MPSRRTKSCVPGSPPSTIMASPAGTLRCVTEAATRESWSGLSVLNASTPARKVATSSRLSPWLSRVLGHGSPLAWQLTTNSVPSF